MRTLEEAKNYLNYHSPTPEDVEKHDGINASFQELIENVWNYLPDGPGKTVAIRAIGAARMQCNSTIANNGN